MKKIVILLIFCFLFFLTNIKAVTKREYYGENEVKVKIIFQNAAVTTRNLKTKLASISYRLRFATIKQQLNYTDETVEEKIADLPFYDCTRLEEDYQQLLKKLGLHEEVEKVMQYGVPLKEIIVFMKEEDINIVQNLGYEVLLI